MKPSRSPCMNGLRRAKTSNLPVTRETDFSKNIGNFSSRSPETCVLHSMRKVPCFNPSCWSRRVHHERPDTPRGQVMCEVQDNWDGYAAFCSMMCAIEAGYMSLSLHDAPCKKCFVASKGENAIHHHGTWKCVKPEVDEQVFQD